MKRYRFHSIAFSLLIVLFSFWTIFFASASNAAQAQQPTDVPTAVSSTGMYATVITEEPQINVRMGPSSSVYPIVGKLPTGTTVPALGRSAGGDWIQIEYASAPNNTGWVYSPLVRISAGTLRIVEPPPTPVQPATATIDPTLAAQYKTTPTSTRLPTFTPPPSITVPAYTQSPSANFENSVPMGVIILALASLGAIGFLLSLFSRR
jgi:uncharacterized protein YraI